MRPVFAFPFFGEIAWPWSLAWYFAILYLTCRIFYLAFLSRMSHFYLTSRIFISHLAFVSRISHFFLSRISHFYLAFNSRNFFLLLSRISNVPYRLPYLQASVLPYISYYPTAARRVQITPKTSTNITRYLHSRGPVRQVCLLLTNQLTGFRFLRQIRSASHTSVTHSP